MSATLAFWSPEVPKVCDCRRFYKTRPRWQSGRGGKLSGYVFLANASRGEGSAAATSTLIAGGRA